MIYGYKQGSQSAKALAQAMGMKVIKHEGSKFKGNPNKVVINWGASEVPDEVNKCQVINKPASVKKASNKLMFFNLVKGKLNIPEYTTNQEEAKVWSDEGCLVVGREILNGHSAKGLHIISPENWEHFPHHIVKMYVKYVPKKQEYRVHVVGDKVIDIRRKALRGDFPKQQANWQVRNHDNGFIFAKDGFEAPQEVLDQSVEAIKLVGLDFGAVDVIWNSFYDKAYVLEVNTAAGLEGSTVNNYAEGFEKLYRDKGYLADADKIKGYYAKFVNQIIAEEKAKKVNPMFVDHEMLVEEDQPMQAPGW